MTDEEIDANTPVAIGDFAYATDTEELYISTLEGGVGVWSSAYSGDSLISRPDYIRFVNASTGNDSFDGKAPVAPAGSNPKKIGPWKTLAPLFAAPLLANLARYTIFMRRGTYDWSKVLPVSLQAAVGAESLVFAAQSDADYDVVASGVTAGPSGFGEINIPGVADLTARGTIAVCTASSDLWLVGTKVSVSGSDGSVLFLQFDPFNIFLGSIPAGSSFQLLRSAVILDVTGPGGVRGLSKNSSVAFIGMKFKQDNGFAFEIDGLRMSVTRSEALLDASYWRISNGASIVTFPDVSAPSVLDFSDFTALYAHSEAPDGGSLTFDRSFSLSLSLVAHKVATIGYNGSSVISNSQVGASNPIASRESKSIVLFSNIADVDSAVGYASPDPTEFGSSFFFPLAAYEAFTGSNGRLSFTSIRGTTNSAANLAFAGAARIADSSAVEMFGVDNFTPNAGYGISLVNSSKVILGFVSLDGTDGQVNMDGGGPTTYAAINGSAQGAISDARLNVALNAS